MKKIVFKALFPILCIISILLGCCSFSAFAFGSYAFNYDFSEPDSYFIVPTYSGTYRGQLWFWAITPVVDSNNSKVEPVVSVDVSSNSYTITFATGETGVSYYLSLYRCWDDDYIQLQAVENVSYNSPFTHTVSASTVTYYRPIIKGDVHWSGSASVVSCTPYFGADSYLKNEIYNIGANLANSYRELVSMGADVSDLLTSVNDILADTDNISKKIDRIYTYLNISLDQDIKQMLGWESWFESFDYYLSLLVEYLMGPEEGFTQSPTLPPNQDEYNKVEDELLNNEEASNAQNSIDIQINESAMSYIWDLITQFLQANSKVFGLFISVLSLGIIALILNR